MDKRKLTAPCGIDCFNCHLYEGNISSEMKKGLSIKLNKPESEIPCSSCRNQKGCNLFTKKDGCNLFSKSSGCSTFSCAANHGIEFCCDCPQFPCNLLMPCSDRADTYPHNLKLFNLCRIKKVGVEKWIDEAAEIRAKYFNGKFVIGKGPTLD